MNMNTNINTNKNIYRLVKPYQSTKVYEASTIMHGAGKCHKELKKLNILCDSFTIMDINNKLFYNFNTKQSNINKMKDPSELLNQNGGNSGNGSNEFNQLRNEINELKNRISLLEGKNIS
jgi:hypothetical protein